MNKYTGISKFYDLIMTAGYYDYDGFAQTLVDLTQGKDKILELGIGTGLVCEKMLAINPNLHLTGIDYTDAMVEVARKRLGDQVEIHQEDVVVMETETKYDAAFSVGGVWYFIHGEGDDIVFCSHIFDKDRNYTALKNIHDTLNPGGLFIFAVQGVHTTYEKALTDDLIYAQKIEELEDHCFIKDYYIKRGDEVLAEQRCEYRLFTHDEIDAVLDETGFEFVKITDNKLFHVYRKKDNT